MTRVMLSTPVKVPRQMKARAQWIKDRMAERGISFAEIARREGLHRGTPQMVLVKPYPRMERLLGKLLGIDPAVLWPERYEDGYHPNGVPQVDARRKTTLGQRGRLA